MFYVAARRLRFTQFTRFTGLTRFLRLTRFVGFFRPIEFRRRLKIDAETILSLTLKEGKIEIVPLRPLALEESLREYTDDEIERFLEEDRLDPDTAAKIRTLLGRKKPA